MKTCPDNTVVFWPLQGLVQVSGAPAGTEMDFEHQSNTPFGQVVDGSNTSSGQSNSHPYPGNPVLTLEVTPWKAVGASAAFQGVSSNVRTGFPG